MKFFPTNQLYAKTVYKKSIELLNAKKKNRIKGSAIIYSLGTNGMKPENPAFKSAKVEKMR